MAKDGQQRKTEARERARIRREQERRRARQRKIFTYSGVIVAVLGVIAAIVIIGVVNKSSDKNIRVAASPAIASAVADVPGPNLDAVGLGSVQAGLKTVASQPPLTAEGKPEVLYIGAEFCPHCAIERWSMAIALSRFGTFSGLETTRSASDDGNLATLTFVNATYTSQYLTFTPREMEDRAHKSLQKLTDDQQTLALALAKQADPTASGISFPTIDFGNKYFLVGDQLNASVISGMSAEDIARDMSNPGTSVGKAIMGSANSMTAAICSLTNNQPTNVCSSAGVTTAKSSLASGGTGASSGS